MGMVGYGTLENEAAHPKSDFDEKYDNPLKFTILIFAFAFVIFFVDMEEVRLEVTSAIEFLDSMRLYMCNSVNIEC